MWEPREEGKVDCSLFYMLFMFSVYIVPDV